MQHNFRLGILTEYYARYNRPVLEELAPRVGRLSLFGGKPPPRSGVKSATELAGGMLWPAKNVRFPFPRPYICWQANWREWLRSFNPDVIVLQPTPRLASNYFVMAWMKRRKRAVVGWGMGQMPGAKRDWKANLQKYIVGRFVQSLDAMLCYSTTAASFYNSLGMPRSRLFVIYNTIDTRESEKHMAALAQKSDWKELWRREMSLDAGLPVVLFVGRLIRSKRVDELIKGCAQQSQRSELLIVGDGPERGSLERLAVECGQRARFPGYLDGRELAKCCAGADFMVLPSLGGLAINTAMAYGKPVIVSVADGTEADLVKDGENGLMFRAEDFDDMAKKIGIMLANHCRVTAMGEAALGTIRNKVNLPAVVSAMENALNSVVSAYHGT